jgi:predicted DNA-binding transcriptional regulator YafY
MPINKQALIRYRTIDNCLRNRFRKWTLEDLVEACSEALYEYEGNDKGVSVRTVQLDIQNMRSDKLGYNAPIIVVDKKYYTYEEKAYSITNNPVSSQDMELLGEVMEILKQFSGFSYFQEMTGLVARLEDKVNKHKNKGDSFIDFEKNELVKGLQHIEPLHQFLVQKKVLRVMYQSFKAKAPHEYLVHPYLLKEYRNRWFLLCGTKPGLSVGLLALDRILSIEETTEKFQTHPEVNRKNYFHDVIGVSKTPGQKPIRVVLQFNRENAPYVLTKPLHASQTVLEEQDGKLVISLEVIWNFELEREIMGFGEGIEVLEPKRLANRIRTRVEAMLKKYS